MNDRRLACPRCSSSLEPGVLLDKGDNNRPNTVEWLKGTAEYSFWTGIKKKGREVLPVRTYRCERCGYLESYAERT
jgi:DNA-directed RNA polymerase subunit RPC12/RpoP